MELGKFCHLETQASNPLVHLCWVYQYWFLSWLEQLLLESHYWSQEGCLAPLKVESWVLDRMKYFTYVLHKAPTALLCGSKTKA